MAKYVLYLNVEGLPQLAVGDIAKHSEGILREAGVVESHDVIAVLPVREGITRLEVVQAD